MTAEQLGQPDRHDVIHLGDQAAVVVPIAEYRRLRALERRATAEDLAAAEAAAQAEAAEAAAAETALVEWQDRDAIGTTSYLPLASVRAQLGLPRR